MSPKETKQLIKNMMKDSACEVDNTLIEEIDKCDDSNVALLHFIYENMTISENDATALFEFIKTKGITFNV